jgi:hypothetical protein
MVRDVQRAVLDAYQGKIKALQLAFDEGDPRFKVHREANLALARMLVLTSNINEARRYYEAYFRLVPQDDVAEIEYIYLFVKLGDVPRAKREFASISTSGRSQIFQDSVARGRTYLANITDNSGNSVKPDAEPLFSSTFIAMTEPRVVQRAATRVAYHGPVGFAWEHHLVRLQTFDESTSNLDILSATTAWQVGSGIVLSGELGQLTQAYRGYLGHLNGRFNIAQSVIVSTEMSRKPLFLEHVLTRDDMDIFQTSLELQALVRDLVQWESNYAKDDNKSPYASHRISSNVTLMKTVEGSLMITPFASYFTRARPSPYYESYAKEYHVGGEVKWTKNLAQGFAIGTEGAYTLKQRQAFGAKTLVQISAIDFEALVTQDLDKSWQFRGALTYSAAENDVPNRATEQAYAVMASLSMLK